MEQRIKRIKDKTEKATKEIRQKARDEEKATER
jgi:hypothetical protein